MATINQFIIKLKNLEKVNIHDALVKSCLLVENEAKALCPVDTGQLRASIHSRVEGNVGTIGSNLDYAPFVCYGTGLFAEEGNGRQDVPWRYQTPDGQWHSTSGQKPQPYLRPALEMHKQDIINIFNEEIKKGLK